MVAVPTGDGMVGMAPPPRIMDELQMELADTSVDERLAEAEKRVLREDKAAPYQGEELAATWEIIRSIGGFLKHSIKGGYELFTPEDAIPVYPLPANSEYGHDDDGFLTITEPSAEGEQKETEEAAEEEEASVPSSETRRVLRRGVAATIASVNLLILRSDQASQMFGSYIHLLLCGLWVCWFPDICHSDNNDAKNTHSYAGLGVHISKINYLCKYLAGPFASKKGSGGRNKGMLRETYERLQMDLRNPVSKARAFLEQRLPAICDDLGIADPHSDAALSYVLAYMAEIMKIMGQSGCDLTIFISLRWEAGGQSSRPARATTK